MLGYRTTDQIDFNEIWYGGGGVQAAIDMYRRVDIPALFALAQPYPEELFRYTHGGKNGFQRLAPGQRPDRKTVDVKTFYPDECLKHGYGVGTDLDTLRRHNSIDIMRDLNRPMLEDPEFVLLQYLKVMMTDPGTANAGYGFWNGEFSAEEKLTTPPTYQQNTFQANHTHYYRTGSTEIALEDISAAKQHISEHGVTSPVAAFINGVERQKLEDLAAWTGNSIIRTPVSDMVAVQGFRDQFYLLGVQWNVTEMVPASYVLMVGVDAVEQYRPLIHFEPKNMRGLELHSGPYNDWPLIESYFTRWMRVKVFNRSAGVSLQLATAGAYDTPTFAE
jgi:hypothetical protein